MSSPKRQSVVWTTLLCAAICSGLGGRALADPLIPEAKPQKVEAGESPHAIDIRARWVTAPAWSLAPYLAQSTGLNDGWSVGLGYVYRRPAFDVVVSLDYTWLQAQNGNFLGKNNNPVDETHFLVFDKLSVLSGDVSLVGHWNLTSWMELRLGAGLGIGGVLGNMYQITNSPSVCNAENAGDPSKCFPVKNGNKQNPGPLGPNTTANDLHPYDCPNGNGSLDTPNSPCFREVSTYPLNVRVVPVLNTQIGFRFKVREHVYVNVDAGWRLVGFFFGGGPEFRF